MFIVLFFVWIINLLLELYSMLSLKKNETFQYYSIPTQLISMFLSMLPTEMHPLSKDMIAFIFCG